MKHNLLLPFLCLIFYAGLPLRADLPYMPVSFQLSTTKKIYAPGERITFKLKITNTDKIKAYPIVLPGSQNKGQKLIYLKAFSVNQKTQYYTTVAEEKREVKMNCTKPGGFNIRNLNPGESVELVFFLNDKKNYLNQIASHHAFEPELKEGKYELLIYYDPSVTEFKDHYHYIGTTNDSTSSEKLNFWYGGNVSNYTSVEISKTVPNSSGAYHPKCLIDCGFCANIEQADWKKVKSSLENSITKSADFYEQMAQGEWMKDHRNVIWLSPPAEAVLSSLPTYFGREMIFCSQGQLHYFYAKYQLGIIYQMRRKANGFFSLFQRQSRVLHGEDLNYIGLKSFGELNCS